MKIDILNREHVTRNLKQMRTPEQADAYLSSVVAEVEDDEPMEVQQFTEFHEIFKTDGHALTVGRTGYGKTTLLLTIIRNFMQLGTKVLYRDDGGLEFGYLAQYHPTQVFIPDSEDVTIEFKGFNADVICTNEPAEIIRKTYSNNYPFNVIVFDAYVEDPALSADFYSKLFMQLIFQCQQTRKSAKEPLIFSIDELNDLIAPRGRGTTNIHNNLAGLFEYNIKKLRKHKVRLFSTTHRPTQLSINVRSQCDHILIKKSYGADIWDLMSRALITANSKTFWHVLKHVITMPIDEFLFFDRNMQFDFYTIPDIPRDPRVEVEALGVVRAPEKQKINHEKSFLAGYYTAKGMSNSEISKKAGLNAEAVALLKYKLRSKGLIQ